MKINQILYKNTKEIMLHLNVKNQSIKIDLLYVCTDNKCGDS